MKGAGVWSVAFDEGNRPGGAQERTGTCAARGSSSTNYPGPSLRLLTAVHSEWLEQASSSAVMR